ncbi:hypothetical protein [Streptomyces griseoruber]|uniref:SH3b domain-containing protein n=1 Tax=Streptomyces griseoruber TaxID=1943 RepID=A0A101T2B6_9ACTN|nr:hypothetical protein [Streptomyces griseoruber]KUN84308.1 hypothetical protein AQJ64_16275 [Streptomyces griseoruber]
MNSVRRKILGLATVFATATMLLSTATSANAAIYPCQMSDSTIPCTTVTGIDPGSWLQVRTGPGYGYGPIADAYSRLYNGDQVGITCWRLGDGAYDNPNYRYWMRVEVGGSNSGYVNDWYLNTGSADVWKQQIRQCPA